jgi:hypothetical protein
MAVEKSFKCDVCGEFIRRDQVAVVRVGTLEDRPEACDRLDVGPCCHARPVSDLLAAWRRVRKLNEEGEPVGEQAAS